MFGLKRGPFTAEQVRAKIAAGRVNAHTRAHRAGSSKWQPLASFPEFAREFPDLDSPTPATAASEPAAPVGAPNPHSPPGRDMRVLADALGARGVRADLVNCCVRSWKLLERDPWEMVGAAAAGILLFVLSDLLLDLVLFGAIHRNRAFHQLVGLVLGGLIACGVSAFYLCLIRKEEGQQPGPELALTLVGEARQAVHGDWSALRRRARALAPVLPSLTGAVLALSGPLAAGIFLLELGDYLPSTMGVAMRLTVGVARLAVAVPVVYFVAGWWFAPLLVFDKGFQAREALELSRRVVTPHWGAGALVVALVLGIGGLGYLACWVGLLAAVPIGLGVVLFLYEDIFGVRGGRPGEPGPNPV